MPKIKHNFTAYPHPYLFIDNGCTFLLPIITIDCIVVIHSAKLICTTTGHYTMPNLVSSTTKVFIFCASSLLITYHMVGIGSYLNNNNIDTDGKNIATIQANTLRFAAITVDVHTGKKQLNGPQEALISEFFGVIALFLVLAESSMFTLAGFYLYKLITK
jgi:hypothetical protein